MSHQDDNEGFSGLNPPEGSAQIVDLAAAKQKRAAAKPRHRRRQDERAQKADAAAANRIRFGRTKAERRKSQLERDKQQTIHDGARLSREENDED